MKRIKNTTIETVLASVVGASVLVALLWPVGSTDARTPVRRATTTKMVRKFLKTAHLRQHAMCTSATQCPTHNICRSSGWTLTPRLGQAYALGFCEPCPAEASVENNVCVFTGCTDAIKDCGPSAGPTMACTSGTCSYCVADSDCPRGAPLCIGGMCFAPPR